MSLYINFGHVFSRLICLTAYIDFVCMCCPIHTLPNLPFPSTFPSLNYSENKLAHFLFRIFGLLGCIYKLNSLFPDEIILFNLLLYSLSYSFLDDLQSSGMLNLLTSTFSQFLSFNVLSVWFIWMFEGDLLDNFIVLVVLKFNFLWLRAEKTAFLYFSPDILFCYCLVMYFKAESILNLNSFEEEEYPFYKSEVLSSKYFVFMRISLRLRFYIILTKLKIIFLKFYWF